MQCDDFARQASERITIEYPATVDDNYGGRTVTWTSLGTFWAAVYPVSGREIIAQDSTQSRVTHKFVIRYQSALKDVSAISDYRIVLDNRYFAFTILRNLARDMKTYGQEFQEIYAEENAQDIHG